MRAGYRFGLMWMVLVAGGTLARADRPTTAPQPAMRGRLSFDLYQNYLIVVQGSAGKVGGLHFLVDTGASSSVLDPRVARRLHLEQRPASLRVVGGLVGATQATVSSLHLGPIQKQDVPVFVVDLSFLQGVIPIPVDGVVGLDLLRESAFLIDYPRRSISFGPMPALPDAIPMVMRDGLAFVQAAVNGTSALLMIDTAAPTLTMFDRAGRNPLDRTVSATTGRVRRIGEFAHEQVVLPSLKLGSAEYGRQSMEIVSGDQPDVRFDGLLSPVALRATRVAIDPGRGEAAFVR